MGCSTSKSATTVIHANHVPLEPNNMSTTEQSDDPPARYVQSCMIVWLGNDLSTTYRKKQELVQHLVQYLYKFDNVDSCIAFINNIHQEKLFVILSDPYESCAHRFHLTQVERIYSFQSSTDVEHQSVIVHDIDELVDRLRHDIEQCELDLTNISIVPVFEQNAFLLANFTREEASFLFAQTIKEAIHRFKFENGSKDVLLDFCRTHFTHNHYQLQTIDDFTNHYRPNKALWWLMNSSFMAKLLSRAFRTREIDLIYKLGFFIKHLNIQLTRLFTEMQSSMSNISFVYRGKTMSNDYFNSFVKDHNGGLLLFNDFLVTDIDKQIAMDYIRCRLTLHVDMIGVLFEIDLTRTATNGHSPFARINDIIVGKDQVCFDLISIFRIESIEQIEPVMWLVKMKPISQEDEQLCRILTRIRTEEIIANPISFVAKLFMNMGEYRRAEQCLMQLLEDPSVVSQPRRLVRVHTGLATNYTHRAEYAKALQHFQQVLQATLLFLPPDHPDLVPIYRAIGDSYLHQGQYTSAMDNYEKAIELLGLSTTPMSSDILADLSICLNKARSSILNNN
jgi:hypothetical protein